MNEMATYTAVFRPDDAGNWLVHIAQEPRCHSYGRSMAAARKNIAEAVAVWLETDEPQDIEEELDLTEDLSAAVADVSRKREQSKQLAAEIKEALPAVAVRLVGKMSMRDAADVLGVSHQRVAQLVEEGAKRKRSKRRKVPA